MARLDELIVKHHAQTAVYRSVSHIYLSPIRKLHVERRVNHLSTVSSFPTSTCSRTSSCSFELHEDESEDSIEEIVEPVKLNPLQCRRKKKLMRRSKVPSLDCVTESIHEEEENNRNYSENVLSSTKVKVNGFHAPDTFNGKIDDQTDETDDLERRSVKVMEKREEFLNLLQMMNFQVQNQKRN